MSTEIEIPVQAGFTPAQEEQLNQLLDASLIYHRDGQGGKKLAYIKGSTAIAHANRIFGYGKWGYRVIRQECKKSYDLDDKVTGLYFETDLELYVVGAAFPFQGNGAAAIAKPYGPVDYENARKSSLKDALKLALVNFGDQFALCLYDAEASVEINGQVVSVRQVPINDPNQPNNKRTVEAGSSPKQLPAADGQSRLKAITDHAKALGVATTNEQWKAMLNYLEISKVNGKAELDLIEAYLSQVEEKRKEEASASGK